MKRVVAEYLSNFDPNLKIHDEYSGRGMFGRTTYAVSGDWGELMDAFAGSIEEIHFDSDGDDTMMEEILNALSSLRFDNLGLGYIFY